MVASHQKLRVGLIALAVTVGCGVAALAAFPHARTSTAVNPELASWSEESWPFPIDQWGTGRAFRCTASTCGGELHLYLRAKIGFCRCATGVSDDDEIDRVGDTELIGRNYEPRLPGHPVAAGLLAGRAREFVVRRAPDASVPVLTIALANRCDAVVATVAPGSASTSASEAVVLDFLRDDRIQRWAAANTTSQ